MLIGWRLLTAGLLVLGTGGQPAPAGETFVRPVDPDYPWEWHLENRGQPIRPNSDTRGTPDADIDGIEAFASGHRGFGVILALIGQGFRYEGSTLESVLWRNPGEIPDNGIDDDGNGFVDDVVGYDFAEHDPDPSHPSGHDRQVAEIAVAPHDDRSVAGIAPEGRLMILKVTAHDGSLVRPGLFRAIRYALDHGARVLFLPWTIRDGRCGDHQFAMLTDVFEAAGNRAFIVGGHPADWPACLPSVVSVQATDADDLPKTGRHASLDFSAPGSDGRTPVAVSYSIGVVAGAAAVLFSQKPRRTPSQVRSILGRTADRVHPELAPYERGWNDSFGAGRINLARALGSDFDGDGHVDADDPDSDGDRRIDTDDPCPLDPEDRCAPMGGP
jgi:subtilisin family serine protease